MGSVIRLVVLAAMLAVGVRFAPALLARYAPPPEATAPDPELAPTSDADAPASEGDALAEARAQAPPEEERTYYRYMDAGGSLHFVDSMERVPEAFRHTARPLSMSAQAEDAAPALTRAKAAKPKRRPFAKLAAQPPAARARAASAGVVVYSTSWCGWCRKTMAWLDAQGVEYENRDIERNPAWRDELLEKTGGTSIPVVEIDGELVRGYSPARMAELL